MALACLPAGRFRNLFRNIPFHLLNLLPCAKHYHFHSLVDKHFFGWVDYKFSIYGFAKPFIAFASRGEVTGSGRRWVWEAYEDKKNTTTESDDILYPDQNDSKWYDDGFVDEWNVEDGYPALEKESSVTGGIFIGPGIEFIPARPLSIYVQAAFGYTFPVSYVSTQSYDNTIDSYLDDEFPMVKKGFPSVNFQVGVSYNF